MFDKITIRSVAGPEQNLDAGTLAEVPLFYGKTHLILDFGRLVSLIRAIGVENLEFLMDNGFVDITYVFSQTGVFTNKVGPLEIHGFVQFQVHGQQARKIPAEAQIVLAFERSGIENPIRSRVSKKLIQKSEMRGDFDNLVGAKRDLASSAIELLSEKKIFSSMMNQCVKGLLPWINVPSAQFSLYRDKGGFLVDTDINISDLNRIYGERIPASHSTITKAYLLSFIWDSILDMHLASHYGSELLTGPIQELLIETRIENILYRLKRDRDEINNFSDFVFLHGKSIRTAINSGSRKFDDIRDILIKSREFRKWLDGINPDKSLVKAYHEAVTAQTWVDKLPAKSTRFTIFTGLGLLTDITLTGGLGTAGGIGLGLLDTFMLDKMIKGWKPNQFVDAELQGFVGSS